MHGAMLGAGSLEDKVDHKGCVGRIQRKGRGTEQWGW